MSIDAVMIDAHWIQNRDEHIQMRLTAHSAGKIGDVRWRGVVAGKLEVEHYLHKDYGLLLDDDERKSAEEIVEQYAVAAGERNVPAIRKSPESWNLEKVRWNVVDYWNTLDTAHSCPDRNWKADKRQDMDVAPENADSIIEYSDLR